MYVIGIATTYVGICQLMVHRGRARGFIARLPFLLALIVLLLGSALLSSSLGLQTTVKQTL